MVRIYTLRVERSQITKRANGRALFLLPVMIWCRTFFEESSSVRFFVIWFGVAPIDTIQVEPCPLVAALIGRAQARSFVWDGEHAVKSYFSNTDLIQEV